MEMDGVTLMMTVEQTKSGKAQDVRDAVNVWMEYDERTHDSYICLRELQNFDGKHEGIHVVCFLTVPIFSLLSVPF